MILLAFISDFSGETVSQSWPIKSKKNKYIQLFPFGWAWAHRSAQKGLTALWCWYCPGENQRSACLFCSKYWAFWIWSCVPVMVMMRSSEPSSGSSILMDAPDSWRICLILWPPLPMMEPASCTTTVKESLKKNIHEGVASLFLSLLTLAYIFWDGDLCCDDWTSDITVRASAA